MQGKWWFDCWPWFSADVIIRSNLPYSEFKVLYFAIYEGDVGRIVNSISSASPLKPSNSFFAFQEENNQRIWFVKRALTNGTHMGIKPNLKVAGSKLNYCESKLERREVQKFKLECVWRE